MKLRRAPPPDERILTPEDQEKVHRCADYRMFALNDWYGIGALVGMGMLTPNEAMEQFGDPPYSMLRDQKYKGILFQRGNQ